MAWGILATALCSPSLNSSSGGKVVGFKCGFRFTSCCHSWQLQEPENPNLVSEVWVELRRDKLK